MAPLAGIFLLLSGIASLTYQVVWVRLLGLSLGSTSEAVGTVLCAFFLGMALGSWIADRIVGQRPGSLLPYVALEFVIGACGLALLPALLNLDALLALSPAFGSSLALKFMLALALLIVPTLCIGATFPVLAAILIRRDSEIGLRLGQLYALNTAGAVLGAALGGFLFIPVWGLDGAIHIAVALNTLVVVLALVFRGRFEREQLERTSVSPAREGDIRVARGAPAPRFAGRALLILFATGLVAIASQVGWTRYLSIFTGTTIYGFAAILTVFLLGLAAGSWAVRAYLDRVLVLPVLLTVTLLLLAVALVATRTGLGWLPPVFEAINGLRDAPLAHGAAKLAAVFALIVAPTFLFGAVFPMALRLYCGTVEHTRQRVGRAYAVNTVAGMVGAVGAGFVVIPHFGTDVLLGTGAIVIAATVLLLHKAWQTQVQRMAFASSVVLVAVTVWTAPPIDYRTLIAAVRYQHDLDARAGRTPQILYLREGRTGVISLASYDGTTVKLQNNGLNESRLSRQDPDHALLSETLLGIAPYLLHPDPRSAFVVGLGGGVTARALALTDIAEIRIVEREPAIVEALRHLAGGPLPLLADPRVSLAINDARNALLVSDRRYDLIVSQPSHPWLAGASGVFSREFWTVARSRLTGNGVFAQWINLFNMTPAALRSLLAAFYGVFPHGFALAHGGDMILLGAAQPVTLDTARIDAVLARPGIAAVLGRHRVRSHRDLLLHFSLSRREALQAAGDAPPNSDTNLRAEVALAAAAWNTIEAEPDALIARHFGFDIEPFLPTPDAASLFALADHFLDRQAPDRARMVARRLASLDPAAARAVRYDALWREGRNDEATALYDRHDRWPAQVRLQQAMILMSRGAEGEALRTLRHIADPDARAVAWAALLEHWTKIRAGATPVPGGH